MALQVGENPVTAFALDSVQGVVQLLLVGHETASLPRHFCQPYRATCGARVYVRVLLRVRPVDPASGFRRRNR